MRTKQKGVALIELALILPFLLLLTFTTTEFGRAIYQYNTIAKSVRNAARYLSAHSPNTHISEAKNITVYGKTSVAGSEQPLALGLDLSHVRDPIWESAGSNPLINTVTITVSGYVFKPLVGGAFGVVFGDENGEIVFGDISATMRAPL